MFSILLAWPGSTLLNKRTIGALGQRIDDLGKSLEQRIEDQGTNLGQQKSGAPRAPLFLRDPKTLQYEPLAKFDRRAQELKGHDLSRAVRRLE